MSIFAARLRAAGIAFGDARPGRQALIKEYENSFNVLTRRTPIVHRLF